MIQLDMKAGPWWLELGRGVRVQVMPATTSLMIAARGEPELRDLPGDAGDEQAGYVFARAVARRAIVDWTGVADRDGAPVEVTPAAIDALLEHWPVFERFQEDYLLPALDAEQEKNASAPSPRGSTAGAKATAKRARKPAWTARKS